MLLPEAIRAHAMAAVIARLADETAAVRTCEAFADQGMAAADAAGRDALCVILAVVYRGIPAYVIVILPPDDIPCNDIAASYADTAAGRGWLSPIER